jgi:hypothetical protein
LFEFAHNSSRKREKRELSDFLALGAKRYSRNYTLTGLEDASLGEGRASQLNKED